MGGDVSIANATPQLLAVFPQPTISMELLRQLLLCNKRWLTNLGMIAHNKADPGSLASVLINPI